MKSKSRRTKQQRINTEISTGESSRMSFGDHLEELRSCLIKGLIGLVVTVSVMLYFGVDILQIICRPLLTAQLENGLQPSLQALGPVTAFTAYLKIGFLGGLIVSMPWLLYQVWSFVSSGLYPQERRFAQWALVPSAALFALGVMFLYFVVLPIVLQFFIKFNQGFDVSAAFLASSIESVAIEENGTILKTLDLPTIPALPTNPASPVEGQAWINLSTQRLIVNTPQGFMSTPMMKGEGAPIIQSQFAIDYYITFVMSLALAFGIAFETPIAVYFLARTGIAPIPVLVRARRYVLLGIVFLAAVLTPPDVISQMLLAGPMYLLFELGILAARFTEKPAETESRSEERRVGKECRSRWSPYH